MSVTFDTGDPAARDAAIAAAGAALERGELVAMPTETVYGLAADATNGLAVARIFAAKDRPRFNPLIVHVGSLAAAQTIARFTPMAARLAAAFWPGPLTLVLPKRPGIAIAELVTAGLDTVAIRVPAHPIAEALLAAVGKPLAAPSANRSGHVSPTSAAHVAADLGDRVAVILDAGPTPLGLESTIIGLAGEAPQLLRLGAVDRSAIEAVTGRPLSAPKHGAAPASPGMLAAHYAPAAKLRLEATDLRAGEALLAFGPRLPVGSERAVAIRNLSETGNLTEAAANLFAALRELDGEAIAVAVMPIPDEGLGEALNDRLRRAAAPRR